MWDEGQIPDSAGRRKPAEVALVAIMGKLSSSPTPSSATAALGAYNFLNYHGYSSLPNHSRPRTVARQSVRLLDRGARLSGMLLDRFVAPA